MNKKIVVVGIGYVGLSMAILLAQHNEVIAVDIDEKKVEKINRKISPIQDEFIEEYLKNKKLNLKATTNTKEIYNEVDFVIIATPTNYNQETNYFDTSSIEKVVEEVINKNPITTIIIKSTIPIGYTERIREKYKSKNIIFSPEFLRESKALYDNLYPSRIIISVDKNDKKIIERAKEFSEILKEGAEKKEIKTLLIGFKEAEAIKLFSNTYLALRVSYFNEIDTYADVQSLNTKEIIEGICLDSRIGDYYNNPSFGYGGYCLPKDTKQLLSNYEKIPQNLITAIVNSNNTRKEYIANRILGIAKEITMKSENNKGIIIGIYRLIMKKNSDNFRESSVQDIIKKLKEKNIRVIIYEPLLSENKEYLESEVINDIEKFKKMSCGILANRYNKILDDVKFKVYTRDFFERD